MAALALIQHNLPMMLWGAAMTILISGVAIILGMPLGLALCFGLNSSRPWLRSISRVYRSVWRGTPILVQFLIIFYLLPLIGINVASILAAIVALTLNTVAFQGEIFRGGLLALPPGQMEAARVVGIRKWAARRHILVPQMFRLVIPSLVNETISILKNSSSCLRRRRHGIDAGQSADRRHDVSTVRNLYCGGRHLYFYQFHAFLGWARGRAPAHGAGDLRVWRNSSTCGSNMPRSCSQALRRLPGSARWRRGSGSPSDSALACLESVDLPPLRWLVRAYIEIMRGLPILILLFVLYYGGPSIGLRLRADTVGVLGLASTAPPFSPKSSAQASSRSPRARSRLLAWPVSPAHRSSVTSSCRKCSC